MSAARCAVSMFSATMVVLCTGTVFSKIPNKPIRMIAAEPGSNSDAQARLIAPVMAGLLGQAAVVENMTAALIAENLAKAPPDGYTVGLTGGVLWLTPLTQKTSYDAIRDFAPITWTTSNPYVLVVHPSVPAKSAKELIGLAKARPGVLNIAAAPSPGAETFLAAELFKTMAGVNMVRVPYKGTASASIAVIAGEVESTFISLGVAVPNAKAGKLRALGVTSLELSPLAPGLPTLAASGVPGYEMIVVQGWLAPGKTPAAIVNRLNQEMVRAISRPDIKEKFFNNGQDVVGDSPAHFAAKINSEIAKWGKLLKDAGVKMEP